MLKTLVYTATGIVAVAAVAAIGLAAAAPERTVAQSFSERVASGAASLMMRGIAAGYDARTPASEGDEIPVIVHVTFTAEGDLDVFSDRMDGFAPFLSNTPGLVWKVWALDPETRDGSGTYMFESRRAADMYLSDVLPEGMGNVPYIAEMAVRITPVMTGPSQVTHATMTQSAATSEEE